MSSECTSHLHQSVQKVDSADPDYTPTLHRDTDFRGNTSRDVDVSRYSKREDEQVNAGSFKSFGKADRLTMKMSNILGSHFFVLSLPFHRTFSESNLPFKLSVATA